MFLFRAVLIFSFVCGFASMGLAVPGKPVGFGQLLSQSHPEVVPLSWTGHVADGGPEYEFNGTAEQILAQILDVNPDYSPVYYASRSTSLALPMSLKRAASIIDCNPSEDWFYAAVSQLNREARYLKSLGDATCSAGAGKCARVSCSYNTAVYFCNLRKKKWGIPCSRLGQQVIDIAKKCETYSEDNNNNVAKGMLRVPGDYELWAGEANPDC